MSRLLATSRRLAFAVAAIALTAGLTASARAERAYAFATETIDTIVPTISNGAGLAFIGPGGVISGTPSPTATSNTGATLSGAINGTDGHNGLFNALQAYVGTPPPPPQDFFQKYASFSGGIPPAGGVLPDGLNNPLGLSPAPVLGDFTRGDVFTSPTGTGSVVAESYLGTPGGIASGFGGNSVTVAFRVLNGASGGAGGQVTLSYHYITDLYSVVSDPADPANSASASLTFTIKIKDAAGVVVGTFPVSPNTNAFNNAPPNGPEITTNATDVVTATTPGGGILFLTPGDYTVNFGLKAQTIVTITSAVPEPATMAMALTALPLLGFGLLRRRNRNRKAQA